MGCNCTTHVTTGSVSTARYQPGVLIGQGLVELVDYARHVASQIAAESAEMLVYGNLSAYASAKKTSWAIRSMADTISNPIGLASSQVRTIQKKLERMLAGSPYASCYNPCEHGNNR